MAGIVRWKFFDPYDPDPVTNTWTVPMNPNAMTPLHPQRNVVAQTTTAIDGQPLLFEGNAKPIDWSFSGTVLDAAHYEQLRAWVYDRKGRRIYIYDHYGREIQCVLTAFAPTPKRSGMYYWRHDYEVKAIVLSVGAPTVGV